MSFVRGFFWDAGGGGGVGSVDIWGEGACQKMGSRGQKSSLAGLV